MKATYRGNYLSEKIILSFARALIVAGLLFDVAIGRAQLLPPGRSLANRPIASWSFLNQTNWTGDQGQVPISFTNLNFSLLGDGASLVVDTNLPAWLNFNVIEPGTGATNLVLNAPTSLTFWYGPNWATTSGGPGGWSQLIDVGEWTSNSSYGYWGLSIDPPGSNLWFVAQDGIGDTYGLSTPISWTTNYFHFLALTISNSSVSIFLDGELATNDPGGLSLWPGSNAISGGVYFGSDTNGLMQAAGLFDDIETYNVPLASNDVATLFSYGYGYYMMSPLNTAMFNITSAPSTPSYTPSFNVISGSGNLLYVTNVANCTDGSTAYTVWLTNVVATVATNGTMNLQFTIEGGDPGIPYDVFANSVLSFGTNGVPWGWMGQTFQCVTSQLTNLPVGTCYLILGTPETSGSGLTDAYESLVAKVNPDGPQSDSYGVPFAWYAENGLVPITNGLAIQDPDQDGLLNYQEYYYGTRPTVSEGFTLWTSLQAGTTSIP